MQTTDVKVALRNYLNHLNADYLNWQNIGKSPRTEIQAKMYDEFVNGLGFKMGKKYVKVTSTRSGGSRSVHSFIVNVHDDPNFKFGDILKAASWAAPARNFARGNIFEGNFGGITCFGA